MQATNEAATSSNVRAGLEGLQDQGAARAGAWLTVALRRLARGATLARRGRAQRSRACRNTLSVIHCRPADSRMARFDPTSCPMSRGLEGLALRPSARDHAGKRPRLGPQSAAPRGSLSLARQHTPARRAHRRRRNQERGKPLGTARSRGDALPRPARRRGRGRGGVLTWRGRAFLRAGARQMLPLLAGPRRRGRGWSRGGAASAAAELRDCTRYSYW